MNFNHRPDPYSLPAPLSLYGQPAPLYGREYFGPSYHWSESMTPPSTPPPKPPVKRPKRRERVKMKRYLKV